MTKKRTTTSGATIQRLADATTREGRTHFDVDRAAKAVVKAADAMRARNLITQLNHQVVWAVEDAARAGALTRRSQAPVASLYLKTDRLLVRYADAMTGMFRDYLGDLTPSVRNDNFIGYACDGDGHDPDVTF